MEKRIQQIKKKKTNHKTGALKHANVKGSVHSCSCRMFSRTGTGRKGSEEGRKTRTAVKVTIAEVVMRLENY